MVIMSSEFLTPFAKGAPWIESSTSIVSALGVARSSCRSRR